MTNERKTEILKQLADGAPPQFVLKGDEVVWMLDQISMMQDDIRLLHSDIDTLNVELDDYLLKLAAALDNKYLDPQEDAEPWDEGHPSAFEGHPAFNPDILF